MTSSAYPNTNSSGQPPPQSMGSLWPPQPLTITQAIEKFNITPAVHRVLRSLFPENPSNSMILFLDGTTESRDYINHQYCFSLLNPKCRLPIKHLTLFTCTLMDLENQVLPCILSKFTNLETFSWVVGYRSEGVTTTSFQFLWSAVPEKLQNALVPILSTLTYLSILTIQQIPNGILCTIPNLQGLEVTYPPPAGLSPNWIPKLQHLVINLDPYRTGRLPDSLDLLPAFFTEPIAPFYTLKDITISMTVREDNENLESLFDARWHALGDRFAQSFQDYGSLRTVRFFIQVYGSVNVEIPWQNNILDRYLDNLRQKSISLEFVPDYKPEDDLV
ncbi:hypothetical protein BDN72DRAFT_857173 [Pluteus cervinus]|uniref:Uncharacterized protein n=1 Tax=Pluteus cervinus TaxID=181527 RepID=A0ACD3AVV4_9AGAR|nr:hypothetical protein BDN72DRAFT_857173 [Pluteus cervinus]